jgi:8-oxo-dGTP pyrophosphatase MutT (NUDIX family)
VDNVDAKQIEHAVRRMLSGNPRGKENIRPSNLSDWVHLAEVCTTLSEMVQAPVTPNQLLQLTSHGLQFDVDRGMVRAAPNTREHRQSTLPDILFHATTEQQLLGALEQGQLTTNSRRRLIFSSDEIQAWRAAHRLQGAARVLCIDTLRARRAGTRFQRNRHNGLYSAQTVPTRHVLNLRDGFDFQLSAGGIPVRKGADGVIRMALIQVKRRSGVTWEIAKGKLEEGETPELAAVREVREEMGVETHFDLVRMVGQVRYGFLAPGGLPRLKTIYLYLITPREEMDTFVPSEREGIGAVAWFTPEEAARAVTHSSLVPLMQRARDLVQKYGLDPAPRFDQNKSTS